MKNNIKNLRKAQKFSQDELAQAAVVTRQTINAIENDTYDPSLELAFKLASILLVRVDELFLWHKENL